MSNCTKYNAIAIDPTKSVVIDRTTPSKSTKARRRRRRARGARRRRRRRRLVAMIPLFVPRVGDVHRLESKVQVFARVLENHDNIVA